nr:MAG TPA: hypothetical protein [Bacteriophage sp.]
MHLSLFLKFFILVILANKRIMGPAGLVLCCTNRF